MPEDHLVRNLLKWGVSPRLSDLKARPVPLYHTFHRLVLSACLHTQKVLKELSVEGLKVNRESDWKPGSKLRVWNRIKSQNVKKYYRKIRNRM